MSFQTAAEDGRRGNGSCMNGEVIPPLGRLGGEAPFLMYVRKYETAARG